MRAGRGTLSLRKNQSGVDFLMEHTAFRRKYSSMPVAGKLLKRLQRRAGSHLRKVKGSNGFNRHEDISKRLLDRVVSLAEAGNQKAIRAALQLHQLREVQSNFVDVSKSHADFLKSKMPLGPNVSARQLEDFAKYGYVRVMRGVAQMAHEMGSLKVEEWCRFIERKIPTTPLENLDLYTRPIFSAMVEDLLVSALGKKEYLKEYAVAFKEGLTPYQQSHVGRLDLVLDWLGNSASRGKVRVKSVCDVGCGAGIGAISTIDTKLALEAKLGDVLVEGVDVVKYKGADLNRSGIKIYKHDYTRSPLPRRYDVLLFSNIHMHLTAPALRRTYENLQKSLNPNGLIVVSENAQGGKIQMTALRNVKLPNGNFGLVPFYGAVPNPRVQQI